MAEDIEVVFLNEGIQGIPGYSAEDAIAAGAEQVEIIEQLSVDKVALLNSTTASAILSINDQADTRLEEFDPLLVAAENAATDAAAQVVLAEAQVALATNQTGLATTQVSLANAQRVLAETARTGAESAANAAQVSALTSSFYPDSRSLLPRGVAAGTLVGGTGYTNGGPYALAFSGGNMEANPTGTCMVSGGVVTSVTITSPGRKIGVDAHTVPTVSFAAAGGGTGASLTLNSVSLIATGSYYWTDHASDATLIILYTNIAGTATATTTTLTRTRLSGLVPCTLTLNSSNNFTLTPASNYSVVGTDQTFAAIYTGSNSSTPVVANLTGIGTGVTIVLENGQPVPARYLTNNTILLLRYLAATNCFVLLSTKPCPSLLSCVHQGTGTANHIKAKIAHAGQRMSYTQEDQVIEIDALVDKGVGGAQFSLYDSDGSTPLVNGASFYEADGISQIGTGAWKAKDRLRIMRIPTGMTNAGAWKLVEGRDRVTQNLARMHKEVHFIRPSKDAPVIVTRIDELTWFVDVFPNLAQYKNGRRRKGGADFVRFVLFDNKALQTDDAFAPCVNSYFVNYKNNMIPVSNLMFTEQVNGITVDNRQVPSTVEGVITQNKLGAAPATNVQAGISHNYMIPDTWTMIGTINDLSTSNSDVTTGELRNMPIGRVVACDKLVNTFTGWITAITGEKTLKFTYVLTFSGTDVKGPMRVQVTYDPTDPACVNGCQVSAGFLPALAPVRLSTRAKAWFNGTLLGTFNVGTQDGVDIVLGTADEVAFVDDDTPDMVFRIKSNIGGGALFTENNVPVVADGQAFIDPFDWGDKLYMGSGFNAYPISGPSRDLAGIVLRSDVYYSFEFGATL